MPDIKNPDAPATPKQFDYLVNLAQTKDTGMPAKQTVEYLHRLRDEGKLTRALASQYIDTWREKPFIKIEVKPGYYRLQTDPATEPVFIQVVENKAKTGTYTKVWNGSGWEYAPDHKKFLPESTVMTTEEMAKFGQITGRCIVCSATLTDDDSIKRGLGPVCAKRVGLL